MFGWWDKEDDVVLKAVPHADYDIFTGHKFIDRKATPGSRDNPSGRAGYSGIERWEDAPEMQRAKYEERIAEQKRNALYQDVDDRSYDYAPSDYYSKSYAGAGSYTPNAYQAPSYAAAKPYERVNFQTNQVYTPQSVAKQDVEIGLLTKSSKDLADTIKRMADTAPHLIQQNQEALSQFDKAARYAMKQGFSMDEQSMDDRLKKFGYANSSGRHAAEIGLANKRVEAFLNAELQRNSYAQDLKNQVITNYQGAVDPYVKTISAMQADRNTMLDTLHRGDQLKAAEAAQASAHNLQDTQERNRLAQGDSQFGYSEAEKGRQFAFDKAQQDKQFGHQSQVQQALYADEAKRQEKGIAAELQAAKESEKSKRLGILSNHITNVQNRNAGRGTDGQVIEGIYKDQGFGKFMRFFTPVATSLAAGALTAATGGMAAPLAFATTAASGLKGLNHYIERSDKERHLKY